jgi:hypothetical protein
MWADPMGFSRDGDDSSACVILVRARSDMEFRKAGECEPYSNAAVFAPRFDSPVSLAMVSTNPLTASTLF